MKVVLDTNIFISGIHWSGPCGGILDSLFDEKFELVISEEIIEEIVKTLKDFKITLSDDRILHWASLLGSKSFLVRPEKKLDIVKDDPDDNKFIEAAVEGGADYIVSQDKHLLNIKEYGGIQILRPEDFLKILD
jgi:putative PIN family toxin of toxin-antitoxin system